jgi:predicted nucleic acid-binding protein
VNAYVDTSAFIKLVILEPGTPRVVTAWKGADLLVAGRLMYAEARAALAAAGRQRRLRVADIPQAKRDLDQFWNDLDIWEVVKPIVEHAGDLAEQHALRGYDAVHLATAMASGVDVLVTADADLLRVGSACGLSILDVRS